MTTIKVPENLADNPEVKLYLSIIEKLESELSSKEPKIPSKPIALSSLRSPIENKELSNNDNIQNLLERCSTCLIEYGRRVLP